MYKISQDHIELFFGSIRSRLGCNNNPSARQFEAAYKRLIICCELREKGIGNCIPLSEIPILTVSSAAKKINDSISKHFQFMDDDFNGIENKILSNFSVSALEFISGFIVARITKDIKCAVCINALFSTESFYEKSLIKKKNRGVFAKKYIFGSAKLNCLTRN